MGCVELRRSMLKYFGELGYQSLKIKKQNIKYRLCNLNGDGPRKGDNVHVQQTNDRRLRDQDQCKHKKEAELKVAHNYNVSLLLWSLLL